MLKQLVEDTHFTLTLDDDGIVWGHMRKAWVDADVDRLIVALQARIDDDTWTPKRFVMDLRAMEDITLPARYATAKWMRSNRGKIQGTAVICKDASQRFVLQTLLRVSGRKNVRAVLNDEEARTFLVSFADGDAVTEL